MFACRQLNPAHKPKPARSARLKSCPVTNQTAGTRWPEDQLYPPTSSRTFGDLRAEVLGQQHFRRHPRHQRAIGVIDLQLQADGLDVAFAPADVALRGEVALHRL